MNEKKNPALEWASMDDAQKFDAVMGSVFTAGKTWRKHGWRFAGLLQDRDSAETIAGEAWPLIPEKLETADTLAIALYRAVTTAAQKIQREDDKWSGRTTSAQVEGPEGNTIDLWEAVAMRSASQARQTAPSALAIARHDLQALAEDEDDRRIMELLGAGFTVRQIATATGTSKSTVQRRIDKIRARAGDPAEWFGLLTAEG